MKRHNLLFLIFFFVIGSNNSYSNNNIFSTAGFYPHENGYRKVVNFNVGWRYYKGDTANAMNNDFDDSTWEIVSLPHSVELLPANASGGRNYQGVVWYRKYFNLDNSYVGKKIWLNFEAIMGKSKIYLNGELIKEQYGGFLPVILDLSEAGVKLNEKNVISVCADNSNDPEYPPGKPQEALDFCYFGGIYRDCWLYTTSPVHITDANYAGVKAGGGVFVAFDKASEQEAWVRISTHVVNNGKQNQTVFVKNRLLDSEGQEFEAKAGKIVLKVGEAKSITQVIQVKQPQLWHPDDPNLYDLKTELTVNSKTVDGLITKIGIRSVEFKAKEGLFINGKHFEDKLLGVNRHQDFGYIGMAMPNNLHYADVLKLRNAGFRVIRSAHYPQDPAFMDACDRLGMFVIVATPGWQFWTENPVFENRVLSDIRNMLRRDRNHPSVLMWEPVLNETHFPESFAKKAYQAVHEEYPYQGCYAAIDDLSKGSKYFDVIYCAPKNENFYKELGKCCFTREFGDCVDDWYSHNSYSRVSRGWSEHGLLHQAQHYAKKDYEGSLTVDQLYKASAAHVGGTLWHSFDHQRGYHPDPFYGGIMDIFRQPKYSYQMFKSLRNPDVQLPIAESGPFVYVAHAMTPVSPDDVVVYSNCDSVSLIITADRKVRSEQRTDAFNLNPAAADRFYTDTIIKPVSKGKPGIPNEPLLFENAFSFVTIRALHRSNQEERAKITAEGIINGKVVATHTQMPSKRSDRIRLSIDENGLVAQANGSDIVVVVAAITDERGYTRHLAMETIEFSVEGAGEIIGGGDIAANPCVVEGGTAPLLIRTTTNPGTIKVTARLFYDGVNTATADTLIFNTEKSQIDLLYNELPAQNEMAKQKRKRNTGNSDIDKDEILREVERNQQHFESTERE